MLDSVTAVGDMAAASERVGEYRAKASQFSKRVFDFLSIMFKFQVDQVLNPKDPSTRPGKGTLPSHSGLEDFLGRYCGLMLFIKEIDQQRYQQICSVRCSLPTLLVGAIRLTSPRFTGLLYRHERLVPARDPGLDEPPPRSGEEGNGRRARSE